MDSKFHLAFVISFGALCLLLSCSRTTSLNPKYDVASDEFSTISENYLQHIARFEWDKSYAYLSEDVVFKLPDGDTGTRTTYHGLAQVKEFWNGYTKMSGNTKASFKDFVHVPVRVNQIIEHIGTTGVFDMCYFSAELSYGKEKADVRMHWAFHFNHEKKIDGIFTYYDRTPIINAAKKNFLASSENSMGSTSGQIVQIIKIKSDLSEEQLLETAQVRAEKFRALPGLLQKYYLKLDQPGQYGGVYVWNSKESMQSFGRSELAAGIAQAYQIKGSPDVQICDVLFELR